MEVLSADPFEPYYFQHEEQLIFGKPVTPITDEYVDNYPTFVDRFYTRYYYVKDGAEGPEPYKVLYHTNRLCLICLAPDHPAMGAEIESINFDIGNLDRSKNVVKGKGKKGGMVLSPETTLAHLTTVSGKTYKIPACLRGKLIEINSEVMANPKLMASTLEGVGYLAIVQFGLEKADAVKASLLTQEEYDQKKLLANDSEKLLTAESVTDMKNVEEKTDNVSVAAKVEVDVKHAETNQAENVI